MARIKIPEGSGSEAERLFSISSPTAHALAVVSGSIYTQRVISMREREAIRMRVADLNQCQICLGFRFPELHEEGVTEEFYQAVIDWRASNELSDREALLAEYAERYAIDHLNIDDALFVRLNAIFTAEEIVEATAIIGGLIANGRMLQVLQLDQQCAIAIDDSDFSAS
ncbi:Uncharacterised protein [BD1-7 clade bacterium]|uniref:Carboxymuconolactone decarboxylase-like domain-containing protein n=1 Tax=BD1-7 clade bacterium TaxID=2029982 RepID=A0A5S9QLK5_9GAMM|nr:Uncharacterised protein [BD1-7 clade bacterium]CAA0121088.1 Uncharacterised protein [BD1-7 clade bacterium]